MASEAHVVRTDESDGVACLVLRNPPVNALSGTVLDELHRLLTTVAASAECRALVLASDGANFSAGADLKELSTIPAAEAPAHLRRAVAAVEALAHVPVPTIAAVHGIAVGGGLELALACDIRVADDSARFGAPEVQYGLVPAYGGTQRLARLVGTAKASELVFTGSLIPAPEALRIGLVNKVVAGGQDLRAARDLAHTIGQRAPKAVRAAKRAIREGVDLDLAAGLELERRLFTDEVLPSEDLAEGIRSFVERRPPKFRGA